MGDYTTFPQVDARRGNRLDPAKAEFIEAKITVASRAIDQWCGQSFTPELSATARTFRPSDPEVCRTDPFWTTVGLVVAVDSGDDGTYATTITNYALERFGGDMADVLEAPYDTIETPNYTLPVRSRRARSVRVTAKWGWAAVPAAVSEACEILTDELYARKDAPFGITANTTDFAGLRIGRDVMAQVASLLTPFRRIERVMGLA
jgi:hypothetical protein